MHYETLFADPSGRLPQRAFAGALFTLLAAFFFYYLLVWGGSGRWGMLVLLYPATVLHARRLRDMRRPVWLLALPVALILAAFWLRENRPGTATQLDLHVAAFAVAAAFALWGLLGKART